MAPSGWRRRPVFALGRVRLIFIADEIPAELQWVVEFLTSRWTRLGAAASGSWFPALIRAATLWEAR